MKYTLKTNLFLMVVLVFISACTSKTSNHNSLQLNLNDIDITANQDLADPVPMTIKSILPIQNSLPEVNEITYGDLFYNDEVIPFKNREDVLDNDKEVGTSGVIIQGVNGLKRQELRKVFVNNEFSHDEIVKDFYEVKAPIHHQSWVGTKPVSNDSDNRTINTTADNTTAMEIITLINMEREQVSLNSIPPGNSKLFSVANIRAKEIIEDFSHTSKSGNQGLYYEALYRHSSSVDARRIVSLWMQSPSHRDVLLNTDSIAQSVAINRDDKGRYTVVLLMQPEWVK